MEYNKVNNKIINSLKDIVGAEFVYTEKSLLDDYGADHTENLVFPPEVLVKPSSATEISQIMKLANANFNTDKLTPHNQM